MNARRQGDRRTWFWSRWDSWVVTTVAAGVGAVLVASLILAQPAPVARVDGAASRWLYAVTSPYAVVREALALVDAISYPWVLRGVGVVIAAVLLHRGERRLAAWLVTVVALSWPAEVLARAIGSVDRTPAMAPLPDATATIDAMAALATTGLPDAAAAVAAVAAVAPVAPTVLVPSGHALTSMVVLGALSVLGLRQPGAPRRRLVAWLSGRTALLVIGLTQVALVQQYPSDVLLGWLLGIFLLGGCGLLFRLAQPVRRTAPHVRRPRVAVVLNPTKVEDVADFRRQVERLTTEFGWAAPLWLETTAEDAGHAMSRSAVAEGVDLVIAAGGDGTVRVVCSELASTGVPIGIVPAGTGNLLVRNLGLPLDPESAIRVALTGTDRRIDLARVDGDGLPTDRFAVMAGLGMDAAVVGDAPAKLKAQVGWPAYVVSIAKNVSFPRVRVEISVDGKRPVRMSARMVMIGNVGTLHGGLPLLPDAAPDDGMLDVVVFSPRRLADWPRLAIRVLTRSSAMDDQLAHWRGRSVTVRAAEPVPRQLDGDVVGIGHLLHCEIEPAVLTIRIPSGIS